MSGGTDNHLFLLDLIGKAYTGKDADAALGRAHITVNKNAVPNDPRPPFVTSGLRIGTPAITTRGFGESESRQVGELDCRRARRHRATRRPSRACARRVLAICGASRSTREHASRRPPKRDGKALCTAHSATTTTPG